MRVAFAAVLIVVGAAAALAADIAIPSLTGRVVDQAGILSGAEESSLSGKLASLEGRTTIQVVVVTLKSLQNRTIEEWGLALGRGWGIGQAGKNNGVLLVVAPNERELRIEVGYGLEGKLPDATADSIIRNVIVPRFKAGNMTGGINDGVDAIGRALTGEALALPVSRPATQKRKSIGAPFIIIIFAAFIIVVSHVRYGRRRRKGGDDEPEGWYWSSGSGSGGSSWSSGSSRGGGFSGGGGSFGGGGASGRW